MVAGAMMNTTPYPKSFYICPQIAIRSLSPYLKHSLIFTVYKMHVRAPSSQILVHDFRGSVWERIRIKQTSTGDKSHFRLRLVRA